MDEMVDVIDNAGNILYPILKIEAHQKGLLHKTVIAAVKNSKGEIMLVRQAASRQEPGQYTNPMGGHVSSGESEENALRREVMEELGIEEFTHELIGKAIFNRRVLNRQENHYFIVYEIVVDVDPVLGDEADSFRIFTKDELVNEIKNNPSDFGESFFFVAKSFYPGLLIQREEKNR